jgi:predicted MFS family arabinose efflux permease
MSSAALVGSLADSDQPNLSMFSLVVMTICAGLIACNQYFLQPLLPLIGKYFGVDDMKSGFLTTSTQVGYALGMLFLIPVTDFVDVRRFICVILIFTIICLVAIFVSPLYYVTLGVCFVLGLTSVTSQLLVPVAGRLSRPERRGKSVGAVATGTVIGILVSRVMSGLLAGVGLRNDFWTKEQSGKSGWKTVFWVAAAIVIILTVNLRCSLPRLPPTSDVSYGRALVSLFRSFCGNGTLHACGMCGFAAFNIFWTCLAYLFRDKYHRGDRSSQDAGLFGLIGVVGAVVASFVARLVDRVGPFIIISVAIVVTLLSFLGLTFLYWSLPGLIISAVLMDVGIQTWNTSIQTILQGSAKGDVTAISVFMLFIGGAIGSASSAVLYEKFEWRAVGLLGLGIVVIGTIIHFSCRLGKDYSKQAAPQVTVCPETTWEDTEVKDTPVVMYTDTHKRDPDSDDMVGV